MPIDEKIARLNRPSPEPVKIEYKRWRNKDKGYIVEVFEVRNFSGKHGFHSVVVTEREGTERRVSWPARTFMRVFEPCGRRLRRLSRWERIDRGD